MNLAGRFLGHLKTVVVHRHRVLVHCMKAGLFRQGLVHDLSKFSPTEFIPGVRYFQGYRSPNESEREDLGMSYAWMHHKGRNKHHFEYWTDYSQKTRDYAPVPMPPRYLAEMVCDRVAACKTYLKKDYTDRSALDYFLQRKDHRKMHPETAEQLEFLLTMIAEKGEEETFRYLRQYARR